MRGVRVPQDNFEQIERGLSAPGSQQVNAEDLLAELVRLVKSPGFALERRPPPVEIAPEQDLPASEPTPALEMKSLLLSPNVTSSNPEETAVVAVEPPEPRKPDISSSNSSNGIGLATRRRSGAWTLGVSALVLVGVAVIGSTYGLEQIMSKPPQAPPSTAAAETPAIAPPRSNSSVAASSDAGVTPPKDIAQPVEGKGVSPEERPVDLNAHNSVEKAPPSQDLASTGVEVAQPAVPVAGAPPAAPLNAPTMAEPVAASPPAASQSLDSKAAPTVLLPPEPTPTATPTPSATDSGVAAHASDAPLPPVRPAAKAAIQAGAATQRSTAKLELPVKLSSQPGAHVVAKAGAVGAAAPETKTAAQAGPSLGRAAGGPANATRAGPPAAKSQSCGARLRQCGRRSWRGGRPHPLRTPLMAP